MFALWELKRERDEQDLTALNLLYRYAKDKIVGGVTFLKGWSDFLGVVISAFGVVISALVALIAFDIQLSIGSSADRSAAVNRSIAVYEDFIDSQSVKDLLDIHYATEPDSLPTNAPAGETADQPEQGMATILANYLKDNDIGSPTLLANLVGLKEQLYRVHSCGGFGDVKKANGFVISISQKEALCDRRTLRMFVGSIVVELFYKYREYLYCPELAGDLSGISGAGLVVDVEKRDKAKLGRILLNEYIEAIVLDFVINDDYPEDWKYFENVNDYRAATTLGLMSEDDERFYLLRNPRCPLDDLTVASIGTSDATAAMGSHDGVAGILSYDLQVVEK